MKYDSQMRCSILHIPLLFLILVIIPIAPQQVPLQEQIEQNVNWINQERPPDKIDASNTSTKLRFAVHPSKLMSNLNA